MRATTFFCIWNKCVCERESMIESKNSTVAQGNVMYFQEEYRYLNTVVCFSIFNVSRNGMESNEPVKFASNIERFFWSISVTKSLDFVANRFWI